MAHLDAAAAAASERLARELDSDGDDDDRCAAAGRPAAPAAPAAAKDAAAAAAASGRPHSLPYAALLRLAQASLDRARSWIARLLEWAGEEFDPWLKWVLFDALFALATAAVARRLAFVRPLFEAVGWT
jgi:hypothetical protein